MSDENKKVEDENIVYTEIGEQIIEEPVIDKKKHVKKPKDTPKAKAKPRKPKTVKVEEEKVESIDIVKLTVDTLKESLKESLKNEEKTITEDYNEITDSIVELASDAGAALNIVIKEEVVELPKVEKSIAEVPMTKKEWFKSSIKNKKFSIYQNNVLIANSNPTLVINIKEDYFEIYGKKYTYNGITIKND